jgi:hypothetical protein
MRPPRKKPSTPACLPDDGPVPEAMLAYIRATESQTDSVATKSLHLSSLQADLAAADEAKRLFVESCLVVWQKVQVGYPDIAEVIGRLGLNEPIVAEWLCTPGPAGEAPAALIAAGRAAEVRSSILRTLHGVMG